MLNKISSFIQNIFYRDNYTLRNFAVFLLVIIGVQYGPLEGLQGVSLVKVAVMAICPLVLITHFVPNRALLLGLIYLSWLFFSGYVLHPESFRLSTLIYSSLFFTMFITFYTIVWNYHVFSLDYFLKLLKTFIYSTVVILLIQQACIILGIHYFPLINLYSFLNRDLGANSLFNEPSQYARILGVLYYAYLKCNEYYRGEKITIKQVFKGEYRWVTFAFLWAMLTMGSGTAFVCLAILSLYFLHGRYLFIAIPIFLFAGWGMEKIGNNSYNRATAVAQATLTGNAQTVKETDGSASARVAPMLNTLNLDFSDAQTWIGHGIDWSTRPDIIHSSKRTVGEIGDYGLIAYIIGLIFVFKCSIQFFSLETIMFFLGVGGGTGNIAYFWIILMIFTVIKYFHDNIYDEYIYSDYSTNDEVEF